MAPTENKRTLKPPEILTERLRLRPFTGSDAVDVRRLAGEKEVASTTPHIPHPYGPGVAEEWISAHEKKFSDGTEAVFAVTDRADGSLLGAVALTIDRENRRAEIGYWIGRGSWGNGCATEAAGAVLVFVFNTLALREIHAHCMTRNPASGRVLEKLGMRPGGRSRRHVAKTDSEEEIEIYSLPIENYSPGQ